MSIIERKISNEYILYDSAIFEKLDNISFSVKTWADRSAIIGFAEGRGTTFFIDYQGQELVLRHYKRGGKIAQYVEDSYFWLGISASRAWREFRLLEYMQKCSLPVPRPVAAHVVRNGLLYKADLITQRIRHSHLLLKELSNNSLEQGHWVALGGVIKRFHDRGIEHVDLNVKNILLDEGGRFHLIDFDKCRKRSALGSWQESNISRFKRSLNKAMLMEPEIEFNAECWKWFMQGYAN